MKAQKKPKYMPYPKEYRKMAGRCRNKPVIWGMQLPRCTSAPAWLLRVAAFCFSAVLPLSAQKTAANESQRVLLFYGQAGTCLPAGNLASDYGLCGEVGLGLGYQSRSRWFATLEGSYLFGNNVRRDPIPMLRNPEGAVIGVDGNDASFKIYQRGLLLPQVRLGKTLSLPFGKETNPLGGLTLCGGTGWMEHWTFIEDITRKTPQFAVQYRKGYDRRSGGLTLGGWIGYLYLSAANRLNLHAEAGYLHGFTYTYRYDFSTGQPAGRSRQDGLFQLRIRICFTVRSRSENTEYYY